jgi:hypothetical protein
MAWYLFVFDLLYLNGESTAEQRQVLDLSPRSAPIKGRLYARMNASPS